MNGEATVRAPRSGIGTLGRAALATLIVLAGTAAGVAAGAFLTRFDDRLISVGLIPVLVTFGLVWAWLGGEGYHALVAVLSQAVAICAGSLAISTHRLGHWPKLGPIALSGVAAFVVTLVFVWWSAVHGYRLSRANQPFASDRPRRSANAQQRPR